MGAGGTVEVAGAGVVAETFPEFEDAGQRGTGKGGGSGKSFQPTLVVGDDGFDAGLLEHDFADPDPVGVAGPAPRQVAPVAPIPGDQAAAQRCQITGLGNRCRQGFLRSNRCGSLPGA